MTAVRWIRRSLPLSGHYPGLRSAEQTCGRRSLQSPANVQRGHSLATNAPVILYSGVGGCVKNLGAHELIAL